MKVVTSKQMKRIDQKTTEEYGISGLVLMENAGLKIFKNLTEIYSNLKYKEVSIFAGSGNNGGDSFVVARHLSNYGVKVKVFLLSSFNKIQGNAKKNLEIIDKIGIEIIEIEPRKLSEVEKNIYNSDLLIDAIFGTGLKGIVSGLKAKVIDLINTSNKEVVAIDIPSGLDANKGQVKGPCIKADYTITLALPKIGLLIYPGANYTGKLIIEDISIPTCLLENEEIQVNLISKEIVKLLLPYRSPYAHKGSFGKVLMIAGSAGMTGAAFLASEAAIKSGTGLVVLGIPKSLNAIMEMKLTEVMTLPLAETKEQSLDEKAGDMILKLMKDFSVLGIGPGVSRKIETQKLIKKIIEKSTIPLVLDADALHILGKNSKILSKTKVPAIITPHPGEMAKI
ncbi:MAG: NAD(P)H-hydrate epimerase, partial [Candidatus Caldatribacteriota bacterium]|nr:NAD(P)H-hydrate epimerase [Candidatus Caldatribacteriota bacterium]